MYVLLGTQSEAPILTQLENPLSASALGPTLLRLTHKTRPILVFFERSSNTFALSD